MRLGALSVLCALLVVGCGGGSGSASSAGSKMPLKAAFLIDHTGIPGNNFGEFGVGAKAAADYVDKTFGGVDGRPIEVTDCDTKNDPGATLACANQAIADKAVMVGGLSLNLDNNALPRLAQAKIPSLQTPIAGVGSPNPSAFPIAGGPVGWYSGGRWIAGQKPTSVGILSQDLPGGHQLAKTVTAALRQGGYNGNVDTVFIPLTTVDLSPAVAKVLQTKPDWVWVAWGNYPAAWTALRQAGYEGNIVSADVADDVPTYLTRAGKAADGLYMLPGFKSYDDTSDPEVRTYRAAMGSNPLARATYTQWGFSMVMTAYSAMKQIKGEVTGASLLAFMRKVPRLHIYMSTDLVAADAPKAFPSLRAMHTTRVVRWENGKVVPIAGPLNGSPEP